MREKEVQRTGNRRKQQEEAKLQRRIEIEKQLRRAKREGMLNIQSLVMKLSLIHHHLWNVQEGRHIYNEKLQFAQTIIQNIYITGTFIVEFLCKGKRHWRARKQTGPRATSVDIVFTEELEEDEVVEQHFVEIHTLQIDARDENIVEAEVQPFIEVQMVVQQTTEVQVMQKHNEG